MTPKWLSGCFKTCDNDVDIDEMHVYVNEAKAALQLGTWRKLSFVVDSYEYYGDTSTVLEIRGEYLETAEQAAKRAALELEHDNSNESWQRKQYEELKKKFGDK